MKTLFVIIIMMSCIPRLHAQSHQWLIERYARLLDDYIYNGKIESRDKILNEIVSEGCRISDRFAMITLSADGSSHDKITANKYIERLRVQNKNCGGNMTFKIQKIEESKEGDDVWVLAKIKISMSDTKYKQFYYPHVLYDKFLIRDKRITWITLDDGYMIKDKNSLNITSCSISNQDINGQKYVLDAAHSRYLCPTIKYTCTTDGEYDIYVKIFDADGELKTDKNSPSGYTYVHSVKLTSGESNNSQVSSWGRNVAGYWKAGDYRFEFYYEGKLIYTHSFNLRTGSINMNETKNAIYSTHEYVDLGLPSGTLWATCNVGANNPWEYGDDFAWGETEAKKIIMPACYKFMEISSDNITKYNTDSTLGYRGLIDNITQLQPCDDAATINWGHEWCTPTKEQWEELLNNCKWEWTTTNGINGFTVRNKQKSIFLPATESKSYTNDAEYMSSTLHPTLPYDNYCIVFKKLKKTKTKNNKLYEIYDNIPQFFGTFRWFGQTVRPVRIAN